MIFTFAPQFRGLGTTQSDRRKNSGSMVALKRKLIVWGFRKRRGEALKSPEYMPIGLAHAN